MASSTAEGTYSPGPAHRLDEVRASLSIRRIQCVLSGAPTLLRWQPMTEDPAQVKLLAYLKREVEGFPQSAQTVNIKQFSHGQSCPTYLLEACVVFHHSSYQPSMPCMTPRPPPLKLQRLDAAHACPGRLAARLSSRQHAICRPAGDATCYARSRRGSCWRRHMPLSASTVCWPHCTTPGCERVSLPSTAAYPEK